MATTNGPGRLVVVGAAVVTALPAVDTKTAGVELLELLFVLPGAVGAIVVGSAVGIELLVLLLALDMFAIEIVLGAVGIKVVLLGAVDNAIKVVLPGADVVVDNGTDVVVILLTDEFPMNV